ncbi:Transcriptional regulator, AsnC family [Candidatus Nitrosotalea sp. TS]|uniref:Lrp/AsnC ligand binding domain-containing protein n=1 Tax=Candidatus Nitrosotalea sp. TS TaxID=2341020 RepID=UPI0014095BB8|nr:Lrp/AsnC ligand binding domain-containing protein [Candidatus Nitrosotalea sp. TS]MDE1826042.1 Lrp/AsnC ligand binding domain-containing protein [Nitrososphaerota archaeon]MDE1871973.1 Lrp/AsnC ligand binding domain-containing protein [Nitrososphaerota archaeon]NHI02761.1 Transcriptional regulator, AsnC family [Candidatus Nitrosotalea sp. TS]
MPTTYILINSDLGSDVEIIQKIKQILDKESGVKYEVQGVYGVYDIIVKITADSMDHLRNIITNNIRKIDKVYSTLTMMVIEEQEK